MPEKRRERLPKLRPPEKYAPGTHIVPSLPLLRTPPNLPADRLSLIAVKPQFSPRRPDQISSLQPLSHHAPVRMRMRIEQQVPQFMRYGCAQNRTGDTFSNEAHFTLECRR